MKGGIVYDTLMICTILMCMCCIAIGKIGIFIGFVIGALSMFLASLLWIRRDYVMKFCKDWGNRLVILIVGCIVGCIFGSWLIGVCICGLAIILDEYLYKIKR